MQFLHWKSAVFGSKRLHRRHGFGTMTGLGGGGVGSLTIGAAAGVGVFCVCIRLAVIPVRREQIARHTSFLPSSLAAFAFFLRSGSGLISSPYGGYCAPSARR